MTPSAAHLGYSHLARYLSEQTGKNIDRKQVYAWDTRRTINAAGQPFPEPAEVVAASRTRPKRLFSPRAVLAWFRGGPHHSSRGAWE